MVRAARRLTSLGRLSGTQSVRHAGRSCSPRTTAAGDQESVPCQLGDVAGAVDKRRAPLPAFAFVRLLPTTTSWIRAAAKLEINSTPVELEVAEGVERRRRPFLPSCPSIVSGCSFAGSRLALAR